MAIPQLKRSLESEGDEDYTTAPISPHKKRLRAERNTPTTSPNRSPLSSPSAPKESNTKKTCASPTPEKEDEVPCTVPAPEEEVKDKRTPPTTPKKSTKDEHTSPTPEKGHKPRSLPPTPKKKTSTVERCILPVVHKRDDWPGLAGFENWVIIGDSLSVEGECTWYEYLQGQIGCERPATIHNCAEKGASVNDDLPVQVDVACTSSEHKPENTLYLLWLGAYDCLLYWNEDPEAGDGDLPAPDLQTSVSMLFDNVRRLYEEGGAGHFIVFDVPPLDRSSYAAKTGREDDDPLAFPQYLKQCVSMWNTHLDLEARAFTQDHPDASLFVVSTHALITALLDDYKGDEDGEDEAEEVWNFDDDVTFSDHAQRNMAEEVAHAFECVEG